MWDRSKQEIALYSYICDTTILRISIRTRIPGLSHPDQTHIREAQLEVGPSSGIMYGMDGLVIEISARQVVVDAQNPVCDSTMNAGGPHNIAAKSSDSKTVPFGNKSNDFFFECRISLVFRSPDKAHQREMRPRNGAPLRSQNHDQTLASPPS